MLTAALVRLAQVRQGPAIWMMIAVPIVLAEILSDSLAPVIDTANPYETTVVGFGLMFAFYGASETADAIYHDRVANNWPRLLSTATPAGRIVFGKAMAPMVLVFVQMTALLAYGVFVRDVEVDAIAATALMVAFTAVSASVLGIVPGVLVSSQSGLNQLSNGISIGLAAVGGAIAPRTELPGVIADIAPITPHYWILQGFDTAMQGGSWRDLGGPVLYLGFWCVIVTAIGLLVLRRNVDRLIEPV